MKVLFIDTHTNKVTIILRNGDDDFKEEKISDKGHSGIVMPIIEGLFKRANLRPDDLDLIVVVNGPGSFTGVRIGVTIAKTMAYTKNIPVKSITSLEAYGVSSTSSGDIVMVEDPKGIYSARLESDKYVDYMYQKKADFWEYIEQSGYTVMESKELDLNKILEYVSGKDAENPHILNPIYIKEIDALR